MRSMVAPWAIGGSLAVVLACSSGARPGRGESLGAAASADTTLQGTFTSVAPARWDFGQAVAIDGDSALVMEGYSATMQMPRATFLRNTNGTWALDALFVAQDPNDVYFGKSGALSGDLAVLSNYKGDFFTYRRTNGVWAEEGYTHFTPYQCLDSTGCVTTGSMDYASVALDGQTLVASAYHDAATNQEPYLKAVVYVRANGAWAQQAVLTGALPTGWDEPFSDTPDVAIHGDTVVLSSANAGTGSMSAGTQQSFGIAFIFHRTGTTWTLESTITSADATPFEFAAFTTLCDDDTAVLSGGAHSYDDVLVYTRSNGAWGKSAALPRIGTTTPQVACDGQNLWICSGSCARYVNSGGAWVPRETFAANATDGWGLDRKGIAASAGRLLVGNPSVNGSYGEAFLYAVSDPVDAGTDAASDDGGTDAAVLVDPGATDAGTDAAILVDPGSADAGDDAAAAADADDGAVPITDDAGAPSADDAAPSSDDAGAGADLDASLGDDASTNVDAGADDATTTDDAAPSAPSAASLAATPPRQRETPNAGWIPDEPDASSAAPTSTGAVDAASPAAPAPSDAPADTNDTGTSAGFACNASGPASRGASDLGFLACVAAVVVTARRRRRA